jgi:hypothetical protein
MEGSGQLGQYSDGFSGAQLLVSDIRTAWLLLNAARYRALERVFGVTGEQANLLTFVALLMLAEGGFERTHRLLDDAGPPSVADSVLGVATVRAFGQMIAGPTSRETPLFGTLVTIAVVGSFLRPALVRGSREFAQFSYQAREAFSHRYASDRRRWLRRASRRVAVR